MKYLIALLSILTMFNCKIEVDPNITINVIISGEEYIGSQNPTFALPTNTKDEENFFDDLDIEENTHFEFKMTGTKANTYNVKCRLWKNQLNHIIIFCGLNEEFKVDEEFSFKETINILYNTKNVEIKLDIESLKLIRIEGNLPFIYSKSQEFNATDDLDTIELNFKVNSYNGETLFVIVGKTGILQLENCQTESNNLKCNITIIPNLDAFAKDENELDVLYINDFIGSVYFNYVGPIKISYQSDYKENINFKIEKLINNEVDYSSFFSFETNITDIQQIKTAIFTLRLSNGDQLDCFFIKHDELKPLYLSCYAGFTGDYKIDEIEGFIVDNIHWNYNFTFESQIINETIHSYEPISAYIIHSYPEILDFTEEESLVLYFFTTKANLINHIKLNEDGEDLECQDIEDIKKCIVTRNHFKDKKNGYYLIHYKNNANKYITVYDTFGIDVVVPYIIIQANVNFECNVGSKNGIFVFHTNTNDKRNFFDDSDIEEKTHFDLQIKGQNNNIYNIYCRLWRDYQNTIAIICDLTEEFKEDEIFSIHDYIFFTYNSKNVEINFDINYMKLNRIEGKLLFLYSKSQEFNITEENNKIELNFKIGLYNNETLFLKINQNGILELEKCQRESNNLKCEISKKKLDVYAKDENFLSVFHIHNFLGSFDFGNVGPILINYVNLNKEIIPFKIERLIDSEVDSNTYANFETNITEIDKIKTPTFTLYLPEKEKLTCFFIKHDKLKPLYLSCLVDFTIDFKIENITEFTKDDLHYKYNFTFGNQTIDITIHGSEPSSAYIIHSNPEILDFTSKDIIDIYIFTTTANNINNLRFYEDGEDLECQDIVDIKKCNITKNYFKNKKNGYYPIYHKNNAKKYIALYDTFGVDVILPGEPNPTDSYFIKINKYSFYLFVFLCLLF